MTIYSVVKDNTSIGFATEAEATAYQSSIEGATLVVWEKESIAPKKTAKDYENFAQSFLREFAQDCISEGNTLAINDALQLHFAELNSLMATPEVARLDKAYMVLSAMPPLLPFFTEAKKTEYLAKFVNVLTS